MRNDWDDLRTILYMVRHGSLSAAAKELGVNYTTVSRRISHAEDSYGARLFDRLPQGYVATEAGLEAAEFAERMESSEAAFRLRVGGRDSQLSGELKVTAPQLLIAGPISGVIDRFLREHPEVNLTILASNEILNLNRREADLAIRISDTPGDTLIGRRLTGQATASFASPELAQQMADDPDRRVDWLGFTFWQSVPKASLENYPNARIRLTFDDMTALLGAAKAGLGVARLPLFLGEGEGLVQVPVLAPQPYTDIWAVAHRDLWGNAKVAAFKDLLVEYFRDNRHHFEGHDS